MKRKYAQLKMTGRLPSPTGAAVRILQLAQRSDVTLNELAQAVHTDQALAGQVLKSANTLHYGSHQPVSNLREAAAIIGTNSLRRLTLSLSLLSEYRSGPCRHFDYSCFWAQAVIRGLSLQLLMQRIPLLSEEEGFCLGLLAHIGRLALATVYPEEYSQLLQQHSRDPQKHLSQLEQREFSITSQELSEALLHDWGLPDYLTRGVRTVDMGSLPTITSDYGERLMVAVQLAQESAIWLTSGAQRQNPPLRLYAPAVVLDMAAQDLAPLCQEIVEAWDGWADSLNLPRQWTQESMPISNEPMQILLYAPVGPPWDALHPLLEHIPHQLRRTEKVDDVFQLTLDELPQLILLYWSADSAALVQTMRRTRVMQNLFIVGLGTEPPPLFGTMLNGWLAPPWSATWLQAYASMSSRYALAQDNERFEKDRLERDVFELSLAREQLLQRAAWIDPICNVPARPYLLWRLAKLKSWMNARDKRSVLAKIELPQAADLIDQHGESIWRSALSQICTTLQSVVSDYDELCLTDTATFFLLHPDAEEAKSLETLLQKQVYRATIGDLTLNLQAVITTLVIDGTSDLSPLL